MFNSILQVPMTTEIYFYLVLFSLICGAMLALSCTVRHRTSRSMLLTIALLPLIVTHVIMLVNNTIGTGGIGTGIAVMGAFSLIRYRSLPGKGRDILAIFASMMVGLGCASGYVWVTLLASALISLLLIVSTFIPQIGAKQMELRITIPEDLNFHDAFDDLFATYTRYHELVRTKTSNLGSMYKLTYHVELKNPSQIKEFMDAIRVRNGNLEVSLMKLVETGDDL